MRRAWHADWIYPGDGPPLRSGYVVTQGNVIQEICESPPLDAVIVQLESAVLMPPLVNAHTHLEFSGLCEPLEPRDQFADWIRTVINWRRSLSGPLTESITEGIRESHSAGTGTIGEIDTSDWLAFPTPLVGTPLVVFREILGLRPESISDQLAVARRHLTREVPGNITKGISPHAPYSVHPDLFQQLMRMLRQCPRHCQSPLAMHLAESLDEIQLLSEGTGPLVNMLRDFGVWTPGLHAAGTRPLDFLKTLGEHLGPVLVIHGNYLNAAEIDFLAGHNNVSLVYCPRTHRGMGHQPHPWRELLRRGIRVAIGTDGRCSNPDLSIWEELRLLSELAPDMTASELLRLATWNGARALGVSERAGRLAHGMPGPILCATVSADVLKNPQELLFQETLPAGAIQLLPLLDSDS